MNSETEQARKKLKSEFKSRALAVFHTDGQRVAYGWNPEALLELVDEYTRSVLASIEYYEEPTVGGMPLQDFIDALGRK